MALLRTVSSTQDKDTIELSEDQAKKSHEEVLAADGVSPQKRLVAEMTFLATAKFQDRAE